jgi:5-(carboxyamino)imidazole ribonucleotide synthase
VIVGVLGGGQLGRMLALAGQPLGLSFVFLDPAPDAPARLLGQHVAGAFDDEAALRQLWTVGERVTYEFENVPVASARAIARHRRLDPPPEALEIAQDRLAEKAFLSRLGIPVAEHRAVDSLADLREALAALGVPAMLKTRRLGYDGKGQAVIAAPDEAESAFAALGGGAMILERRIDFAREIAVVAARDRQGRIAIYPPIETVHRGGLLRLARAPAPRVGRTLHARVEDYAERVLQALAYVGVAALEMFEVGGELVANELAPRVHNSGHWTIEGAETSQFENHLRAICDWPLGSAAARGYVVMVNLVGELPAITPLMAVPGLHVHLYGKSPRPGRKLGHVTLCAGDEGTLRRRWDETWPLLGEAGAAHASALD